MPSWAWAQAEGRAREGPLPFRQGGGARVIFETGRHEALGCLPYANLLLAKPSYPFCSPGHAVLLARASELPPTWPSLALCDLEQVTCMPVKWKQK